MAAATTTTIQDTTTRKRAADDDDDDVDVEEPLQKRQRPLPPVEGMAHQLATITGIAFAPGMDVSKYVDIVDERLIRGIGALVRELKSCGVWVSMVFPEAAQISLVIGLRMAMAEEEEEEALPVPGHLKARIAKFYRVCNFHGCNTPPGAGVGAFRPQDAADRVDKGVIARLAAVTGMAIVSGTDVMAVDGRLCTAIRELARENEKREPTHRELSRAVQIGVAIGLRLALALQSSYPLPGRLHVRITKYYRACDEGCLHFLPGAVTRVPGEGVGAFRP